MNQPLLVPARFNGPPRSGNGGFVGGSLAACLDLPAGAAITVDLRRPPPLEQPLPVRVDGGGLTLGDPDAVVALASPAEVVIDPIEPVSHDEALAATAAYPGLAFHPFPTCFVCGVDRPDGLRIFPGEVSPSATGQTRVAAVWTPGESVEADLYPVTWGALDCIGGWAGDLQDRLMVLARMTAVIDTLPEIGTAHTVMGMAGGHDGRKTWTSSTLFDPDGRVVARAAHLWIAVDPATFNS